VQAAKRALIALGIAVAAALPAAGCSWAGAGGGSGAVRVLMVNNPQQVELQALTAKYFTARTGIKVDFKVLPENDLRDAMNEDVANQAGQYENRRCDPHPAEVTTRLLGLGEAQVRMGTLSAMPSIGSASLEKALRFGEGRQAGR
jgi:hypothetical protein